MQKVKRMIMSCRGERILFELLENSISEALWGILPFGSRVNRWGKEIYFQLPFKAEMEDTVELVQPGDVAYWAPGSALCIFWGPTPASRGEEIRPASGVSVFGRVTEGMDILINESIRDGDLVVLERAGE
ncbi:MAG TPA: cyclophilin-like fold protein [Synergistales bacterium]|nr:cyclophilin-like fold protein [Synergistales bacterium]